MRATYQAIRHPRHIVKPETISQIRAAARLSVAPMMDWTDCGKKTFDINALLLSEKVK